MATPDVLRARVREWHRAKYRADPEWAKRRNDNVKRWVREQKARGKCTKCTEDATHGTVCQSHFWSGRERNWKKHGITMTLADYRRRLEAQGFACPLCRRPITAETAVVDHCHATGRVRGVLCIRCNCAIGALGDTEDGLARVLSYLEGKA